MDLRQLRYFVALAEELHFGRAAVRLGISQPPLSQQIKALEEDLNARLFDRNNRHVALTEAGRLFLHEALATLAQAERARDVAARAQRGEVGELTVGLFPSALLAEPVAESILAFRRSHPTVRLILRERAVYPALEELAQGQLGIAFIRYPTAPNLPPGFGLLEMLSEPMMAVLHEDHPLAKESGPLPLSHLAGEGFIHFSPRSDNALHDQVAALCQSAGFDLRIEQEANQNGSILALIGNGLGVSVLPRSLCRLRMPELRVRQIADANAVSRIWLAYRTRRAELLPTRLLEIARQRVAA